MSSAATRSPTSARWSSATTKASSLSHWTTDLRFEDLARFLAEAGEWAGHRRIRDIRLEGEARTESLGEAGRGRWTSGRSAMP